MQSIHAFGAAFNNIDNWENIVAFLGFNNCNRGFNM